MKLFLKILAGVLLAFNGMSALYGGLNLLVYPNGNSLQLPLDYLQQSPFENYFVPGLVLFCLNGLSSLFVCVAILLDSKRYAVLILIQGCVLAGWIFVQSMMTDFSSYLQLVFAITAFLLIFCGTMLVRSDHSKISHQKNRINIA